MTERDFTFFIIVYLLGIVASGILATVHSIRNKRYRYKDRFKFYISVIWLSWVSAILLGIINYLEKRKIINLL